MRDHQVTVGVLGGMGPDATLDFMSKVIALTPAERDQDHIHMIVDHNPKVPNRQLAIRQNDPAVVQELSAMAQRLENAGADFLVMVCNSAHAFLEPIRQSINIPFVSIIDESIREIERILPGARRVGVLATDGLIEAGIFQDALVDAGYAALVPEGDELERLMALIHQIKAGDKGDDVADAMALRAESLVSQGAEVVIAGCTEIPLVLRADTLSVPLIASTDVLARRTIDLASRTVKT